MLFWEHEGSRAVRKGAWKLVSEANKPWELYDMGRDRTELHDLSSQYPDTVIRLKQAYDSWALRMGVQSR
jgi:arylsulfatase